MKSQEKYVVLEHLTLPDKGLRFWTTNTDDNTTCRGEIVYKEIMFTSDTQAAINESCKVGELPSTADLHEYYLTLIDKEIKLYF